MKPNLPVLTRAVVCILPAARNGVSQFEHGHPHQKKRGQKSLGRAEPSRQEHQLDRCLSAAVCLRHRQLKGLVTVLPRRGVERGYLTNHKRWQANLQISRPRLREDHSTCQAAMLDLGHGPVFFLGHSSERLHRLSLARELTAPKTSRCRQAAAGWPWDAQVKA